VDSSNLLAITEKFALPSPILSIERFGNGLINDTYLANATSRGSKAQFVFQRINHHVFREPTALMRNVERVCSHLHSRIGAENLDQPHRRSLTIVPTTRGVSFHRIPSFNGSSEAYWRCFHFIDGCTSHDVLDSPAMAYQAAHQFGEFQRLVADLDGERLTETIPDFHNTPKRFTALRAALVADPHGRVAGCEKEIRFAIENEAISHRLLSLHHRGLIPERITHNDTKVSNVLICDQSRKGICVVDLDTVMPGLSLYDFGDLMRTCISPVAEDSRDLDAIEVRLPMFEALAAGFLDAMHSVLTPEEIDNLAFSGILLSYELGLRFLTDHILGDTYFSAKHPEHNLHRARNQFALARKIQARESEMSNALRK
jgi:hypothetical protein